MKKRKQAIVCLSYKVSLKSDNISDCEVSRECKNSFIWEDYGLKIHSNLTRFVCTHFNCL